MCIRKKFGGMGFCHLQAFNLAMLEKQGWNLISSPDTLVCRLLKAKYYPHEEFLLSQLGSNPSFTWRVIWGTRTLLNQGIGGE